MGIPHVEDSGLVRVRSRHTFLSIYLYRHVRVISIIERSQIFFEQRLLYCTKEERKNILKMNIEVGMLLQKKELIQVEYRDK